MLYRVQYIRVSELYKVFEEKNFILCKGIYYIDTRAPFEANIIFDCFRFEMSINVKFQ